jgi:hypothetical protein
MTFEHNIAAANAECDRIEAAGWDRYPSIQKRQDLLLELMRGEERPTTWQSKIPSKRCVSSSRACGRHTCGPADDVPHRRRIPFPTARRGNALTVKRSSDLAKRLRASGLSLRNGGHDDGGVRPGSGYAAGVDGGAGSGWGRGLPRTILPCFIRVPPPVDGVAERDRADREPIRSQRFPPRTAQAH